MVSTSAIQDNTQGGGSGVSVAGPFQCGTGSAGCAFQWEISAIPTSDLALTGSNVVAFGLRTTAADSTNSFWRAITGHIYQLCDTGNGACGGPISGLTTNGVVVAASSSTLSTPATNHVTLAASNLVTDSTVTVDLEGPVAIGTPSAPANFVLNASVSFGGSIQLSPGSAAGTDVATFPDNNGTVAELNLAQTWSGGQTFGNSGIILTGSGAGKTTFTSANSSGTNYTLTFPANTGTAAELNLAQTFTALQTFGSNASIAATAHGVLVSENTSAAVATAAGAAGTVLIGNGAADPTFSATPTLGASGTLGSLAFGNATSGTVTIEPVTGALGSTTMLIPAAVGNGIFTQTIASGTATLGTSSIASGSCATVVTVAGTGIATTDDLMADFNADPTSTTGYSPSSSGMLTIIKYPTSGNVNFKVCNNTAGGITPGAVTLNWRVVR
jgi:hypothetical protein